MDQLSLYDIEYEKFKINKPIRLIELFSGYGSQALALKYLGVPFEHWKTCEWAIKSIQAYKDIHFTDTDIELNPNRTKEEMVEFLYQKGISNNYNEPMTKQQISRLSEDTLKTIIKNIAITHNLVNIQQVKGEDLEIVNTDKFTYLLTYSFPCQDLSLAGKGKGMSDTSTRSGLLWEVERILNELEEKPQILLMENVPMVHSQDNVKDFIKWQLRLEEMGYKNYWQDLIATDYGIPQIRNRTFMVSILGDYSYTFPKPIPLELKLKDMLEEHVDEKYYLSDKTLEQISNWGSYQNPLDNVLGQESVSPTITTRIAESQDGGINASMKVYSDTLKNTTNIRENVINIYDEYNHKVNGNETIGTIQAMYPVPNHGHRLIIKNATSQGYLLAEDGDGIDISSRMESHRGTVQKQKSQTITTMGGENVGVAINIKTKLCNELIEQGKVKENDVIRHNYTKSKNGDCIQNNNEAPTLDTRCDCLGIVNNLRIRKLTPKECFRLMGVKDQDYDNVCKNQSDISLYHLAGDSIVVNVLIAIFKELL